MKKLLIVITLLVLPLCGCGPQQTEQVSLLKAAEQGQLPAIDALLQLGSGIDERDKCQFTPLMHAALNGHLSVVERLILFGADIEASDKAGYSALLLAAVGGHTGVAKLLLASGADVNRVEPTEGLTALIIASRGGNQDLVELLLEKGAELRHRDLQGLTALHWAARMEHESLAQRLVAAMASHAT